MGIRCFLVEPSGRTRRTLRRWTDGGRTETHQHAARRVLDVVPTGEADSSSLWRNTPAPSNGVPPSLWPTHCDAGDGFEFTSTDIWQLLHEELYAPPSAAGCEPLEFALRDAPPGAMWDAPWFAHLRSAADGRCLVVQTPGGEWVIDGPSDNGDGWVRTGTPPALTVTPSIDIPGKYHGWLRAGELVEV